MNAKEIITKEFEFVKTLSSLKVDQTTTQVQTYKNSNQQHMNKRTSTETSLIKNKENQTEFKVRQENMPEMIFYANSEDIFAETAPGFWSSLNGLGFDYIKQDLETICLQLKAFEDISHHITTQETEEGFVMFLDIGKEGVEEFKTFSEPYLMSDIPFESVSSIKSVANVNKEFQPINTEIVLTLNFPDVEVFLIQNISYSEFNEHNDFTLPKEIA